MVQLSVIVVTIAGQEGAIRLTDSGNGEDVAVGVGVLEIFHAGAWGSVCAAEQDSPAFRTRPPSPFTEVCLKCQPTDGRRINCVLHVSLNVPGLCEGPRYAPSHHAPLSPSVNCRCVKICNFLLLHRLLRLWLAVSLASAPQAAYS